MEKVKSKLFTTDKEIIGSLLNPVDANQWFVCSNQIYHWYPPIAEAIRPRSIGEIGCRWGYSLKALLEGWSDVNFVVGYDFETYQPGSNDYCRKHLAPLFPKIPFTFHNQDTQKLDTLGNVCFDLFSVDGDHTTPGAYHDMNLVWPHIEDGGIMMVDDLTDTRVHQAWAQFTREKGLVGWYVPTLHGLGLVRKEG
ncbi:class I SAM-dependent methyltransferase [Frigoriglobus tundricola]|uniref:Class I SAM-dependent methyltransferase n=1 Tax=Frigoriglobus tundricola TaxID=2774151 RepID=A0A6M5YJ26_9BACT|nr:class I SAM-dependent methyltransferase [Frigoriglobus tundricola]QJW93263.1 hypothetical protein FTUN_0768 [Frigoriglobus tundricola]